MPTSFDLLVAGEINPDLILTGDVVPGFNQVEKLVDSAMLTVGSSSAIFACGAARLGLKVALVGICGADIFGHFMMDELARRGVDTSAVRVDPQRVTGLSVILSRGRDRAILTHPGSIADLHGEDVSDDLLRSCRHLHVGSYFLQTALQPGLPELFRKAHRLGLTTSLDTNWDPSGRWREVQALLLLTDVFLPNENEAIAISQASSAGEALQWLSRETRIIAMKRGSKGGLACQGGKLTACPALEGDLVDAVGAGDTFNAGFVYGFLNGWTLEKTLHLATVCGSLSTRGAGGTSAQPTLEEAMLYVQPSG